VFYNSSGANKTTLPITCPLSSSSLALAASGMKNFAFLLLCSFSRLEIDHDSCGKQKKIQNSHEEKTASRIFETQPDLRRTVKEKREIGMHKEYLIDGI
jgi:hypothetical protein